MREDEHRFGGVSSRPGAAPGLCPKCGKVPPLICDVDFCERESVPGAAPEDVAARQITWLADDFDERLAQTEESHRVFKRLRAALAALVVARDEALAECETMREQFKRIPEFEEARSVVIEKLASEQLAAELAEAVAARDTAERERDAALDHNRLIIKHGREDLAAKKAAEASRDEAVAALRKAEASSYWNETKAILREALARVTGQPLSEEGLRAEAEVPVAPVPEPRDSRGATSAEASDIRSPSSLSGPVTGQGQATP